MRQFITIIALLIAQVAISQQAFPLSDSITITHDCADGTFVDFVLQPGDIAFTFPNSHEVYHLGEYDADPVWDASGYYWSCFYGNGFHGFYLVYKEDIHVRLVLEHYGCILMYGSPSSFTPKCFKE